MSFRGERYQPCFCARNVPHSGTQRAITGLRCSHTLICASLVSGTIRVRSLNIQRLPSQYLDRDFLQRPLYIVFENSIKQAVSRDRVQRRISHFASTDVFQCAHSFVHQVAVASGSSPNVLVRRDGFKHAIVGFEQPRAYALISFCDGFHNLDELHCVISREPGQEPIDITTVGVSVFEIWIPSATYCERTTRFACTSLDG